MQLQRKSATILTVRYPGVRRCGVRRRSAKDLTLAALRVLRSSRNNLSVQVFRTALPYTSTASGVYMNVHVLKYFY